MKEYITLKYIIYRVIIQNSSTTNFRFHFKYRLEFFHLYIHKCVYAN